MRKSEEGTTNMSHEKTYELMKIHALEEIKSNFMSWAKTRFWLCSFLLTVIGFFGGSAWIDRGVEKCAEKELGHLKQVAYETEIAGVLAENQAAKATEAAEGISTNLAALEVKAQNVSAQYLILQQELEGETGNIRRVVSKEVDSLKSRLEQLEELVTRLAKDTKLSENALTAYKIEVTQAVGKARERDAQFNQNAKYHVSIYFNEKTRSLSDTALDTLVEAGFKAASTSILRVQEQMRPTFRSPVQMMYSRDMPDIFPLTENTITYTGDVARQKADDVRTLLAKVDGLTNARILTREFFVGQYGTPYLAQAKPERYYMDNLIEVYLVKVE